MSHINEKKVIPSVGEIRSLVEKAKKGDKHSFEKLYEIYLTPIYRYVFSRTRDKDKTDDIVQTVFIKWFTYLPTYELRHSPLQYLFVIARREIIDDSKNNTVDEFDENQTIVNDENSIEEKIDLALTVEEIMRGVAKLNETDQELISLHFFGELSTKEISEIMEKSEENIRQMKVRALARLRGHLRDLYENHN